EFEDAVDGFQRRGRPYVMLFRKVRKCMLDLADDPDTVRDRVDQYRRLESFINSRMKGPTGEFLHAFNEFEAADELEAKIGQKLEQLVVRLLEAQGDGAGRAPVPAPAPRGGPGGLAGQSPFRGLRRFEP